MLDDLEWSPLQQRKAESRLALFHRIVNRTVDISSAVLMKESRHPSRKANKVQYMRHSTKKDCYKYSFVPRSIVQWNNINALDDHAQFKSKLSFVDLRRGGDTRRLLSTSDTSRTLYKCSLRRVTATTTDTDTELLIASHHSDSFRSYDSTIVLGLLYYHNY